MILIALAAVLAACGQSPKGSGREKLAGAGATFPYGVDPQDSNIRIAPSLPPVAELEKAMEVFCVSLKLAALEKLLA